MKTNINENHECSQSQESKILSYMLEGHRITGMEALELCGCWRLPARIADIKKHGFNVQSRTIVTESGKKVKQYWI